MVSIRRLARTFDGSVAVPTLLQDSWAFFSAAIQDRWRRKNREGPVTRLLADWKSDQGPIPEWGPVNGSCNSPVTSARKGSPCFKGFLPAPDNRRVNDAGKPVAYQLLALIRVRALPSVESGGNDEDPTAWALSAECLFEGEPHDR